MTEDARTRAPNNDGSVSGQPLRVALYARVSTADKGQDPEMQLVPMRERAAREGWVATEYTDHASAGDLAGRRAWQRFMADARARRIDVLMVWALDRGFRSTRHFLNTTHELDELGVGFASHTQDINTTTAYGEFFVTVMAAIATLEKRVIRERVVEGLANARRRGSRLGRPPATERPGFGPAWRKVKPRLEAGQITKRAAARELGVGEATLHRLLRDQKSGPQKASQKSRASRITARTEFDASKTQVAQQE